MLTKNYNIKGSINCTLKYLSDPSLIDKIENGNESNVLLAECRPLTMISHEQAINFPIERIKLVLNELKKIEEEYPLFYAHFDIDYSNYHIGPTIGQNGIVFKFDVKPLIKLKDISGGGFIGERDI